MYLPSPLPPPRYGVVSYCLHTHCRVVPLYRFVARCIVPNITFPLPTTTVLRCCYYRTLHQRHLRLHFPRGNTRILRATTTRWFRRLFAFGSTARIPTFHYLRLITSSTCRWRGWTLPAPPHACLPHHHLPQQPRTHVCALPGAHAAHYTRDCDTYVPFVDIAGTRLRCCRFTHYALYLARRRRASCLTPGLRVRSLVVGSPPTHYVHTAHIRTFTPTGSATPPLPAYVVDVQYVLHTVLVVVGSGLALRHTLLYHLPDIPTATFLRTIYTPRLTFATRRTAVLHTWLRPVVPLFPTPRTHHCCPTPAPTSYTDGFVSL